MEGDACLRGRDVARAGWSPPWARGSPFAALAFSPLRAMGKMIEPRASWVRGRPRPHAETAGW